MDTDRPKIRPNSANSRPIPRRSRSCWPALSTAATAAIAAFPPFAAAQNYWTGAAASGSQTSWTNDGNWIAGVPGDRNDAVISPNTTASVAVTYDYAGPAVTLNSFALDYAPGTSSNSLIMPSADTLTVSGTEIVGLSGSGIINQSAGANNATGGLYLAMDPDSTGTYTLSGTGALASSMWEAIGQSGTGTFIQSGGSTSTINGGNSLYLGFNGDSLGTYSIGGTAALTVSGYEYAGYSGVGSFNQTGGSNTIAATGGALMLGYFPGSSGSYTLSGAGVLSANGNDGANNSEIIGVDSPAVFIQSGGTNTLTFNLTMGLNPGSTGSYTLTGTGALAVGGSEYIGVAGPGYFLQTGGSNTISGGVLSIGYLAGTSQAYSLSGTGTLTATGADANGYCEYVGYAGAGAFTQSGGTNSPGTNLGIGYSAGSTGTYILTGAGAISAGGAEAVGVSGIGTFSQTSGTNTLVGSASVLYLGFNAGSTGFYTLSGTGSLTASGVGNSESIGFGGVGLFIQSSGTNKLLSSTLIIGNNAGSTGTYILSGTGALTANAGGSGGRTEVVGNFGLGTFNQSSGTNTVKGPSGVLALGDAGATGIGTYLLTGIGSLTVTGTEFVGFNGDGIFTQTGGTNTLTGNLFLGRNAGSTGTYTLTGASAAISGNATLGAGGAGVLTVATAGMFNVGGTLAATNTPGTGITLSGGTINTAALNFGGVPSLLTWPSGTLNITSNVTFDSAALTTATGAAFGPSLTLLSGQTLIITGNETVGGTGSFALTLNSGAVQNVTGSITLPPTGIITQNIGSALFYSTFTQSGGSVNGTLQNQSFFTYQSGPFNGRLLNQGTVNLGSFFTAGNGVENDTTISVSAGQFFTVNGQGLDNLGTFNLTGGTINGAGPALNDFGAQMSAFGTINQGLTNDGTLNINGALTTVGPSSNVGQMTVSVGGQFRGGALANGGLLTLAGGAINSSLTNGVGGIIQGYGAITNFTGNGLGGEINLAATTGPLNIQGPSAGPWTNSGQITLQANGAILGGGVITNAGTIQGQGEITATVLNNTGIIRSPGGEIDLAGTGNTNGTTGQIQVPTGGTILFLQGLTTNAGTISLSGGTFDNGNQPMTNAATGAITGSGTFRGGGLTNSGALDLLGSANVSGGVTNNSVASILLTGTGTNVFSGPLTNDGTLTVDPGASGSFLGAYTGSGTIKNNGSLFIHAASSFGPITGSGALTLGDIGNPVVLKLLPLGTASTQSSLLINTGSTLDMTSNKLVLNYVSPSLDPVSAIAAALTTGYNSGDWMGPGIDSTTAGANHAKFAVGYLDGNRAADVVGRTVQPNQIILKYTLAGDAFLENSVGFDDLVVVAQNFGKSGQDWAGGNFTYDPNGSVGFADLVNVAQNFGSSSGVSEGAGGGGLSPLWQTAQGQGVVPEPATIALFATIAAGLLVRRRRS